jgi:hypothetical protein
MGTLGGQETIVIFVLALVLFGKKLPELAPMIGKATTGLGHAAEEEPLLLAAVPLGLLTIYFLLRIVYSG